MTGRLSDFFCVFCFRRGCLRRNNSWLLPFPTNTPTAIEGSDRGWCRHVRWNKRCCAVLSLSLPEELMAVRSVMFKVRCREWRATKGGVCVDGLLSCPTDSAIATLATRITCCHVLDPTLCTAGSAEASDGGDGRRWIDRSPSSLTLVLRSRSHRPPVRLNRACAGRCGAKSALKCHCWSVVPGVLVLQTG
ncbi:hypothetical protein LZ30DRAFT_336780 [Colletotrichum cereale]|nr:hypothetical protein LZ30DRAFT_336780 [Colletotrichum cereale]